MINIRISLFFLNLFLAAKKKIQKENMLEEMEEEDGESGNVQGKRKRGGEVKGLLCKAGFCFH